MIFMEVERGAGAVAADNLLADYTHCTQDVLVMLGYSVLDHLLVIGIVIACGVLRIRLADTLMVRAVNEACLASSLGNQGRHIERRIANGAAAAARHVAIGIVTVMEVITSGISCRRYLFIDAHGVLHGDAIILVTVRQACGVTLTQDMLNSRELAEGGDHSVAVCITWYRRSSRTGRWGNLRDGVGA